MLVGLWGLCLEIHRKWISSLHIGQEALIFLEGFMDLFFLKGLEDLINAIVFNGLKSVFIVCCTKYDRNDHIYMLKDFEAFSICQLNIEK